MLAKQKKDLYRYATAPNHHNLRNDRDTPVGAAWDGREKKSRAETWTVETATIPTSSERRVRFLLRY